MKEGFINALMADFIIRGDFMPLKDESGNIITGGIVSTIVRQSYGSLVILEFIDTDRQNAEELAALLENNAKRLDGIDASQCYIFEVFISGGAIDAEKLKIINDGQLHRTMAKKYAKCMTVDLEAGTVIKHFKAPVTDFGIGRTISARLAGKAPGLPDDVRLDEVVRKREEERSIRFRAKKPFLTYVLIAVNIVVFGLLRLYSMKSGSAFDDLLSTFGSKINSNIMNGEYWRLITPMFLHANEIHLLINCYSLFAVGITVEKVFGHARFSAIYLFAGILGNLFSFMFSINPAVGASGAIFGLLGALLYFGLERPALFKAYFGYSVITTIVINLAYGFSNSGIDNFAHMGGLLGGFLASGAANVPAFRKWYLNRLLYMLLALAITAGGLFYGFNNGNNLALGNYNKLQTLANSGNYGELEKVSEKVLAAGPANKDLRSYYTRGALLAEAQTGKLDEALQHSQQLVGIDPAEGHYFTGIVYYYMNRFEDSKSELLKAKELKVRYSDVDQILSDIESRMPKQ